MKKKILLIGSEGSIGTSIFNSLKKKYEIIQVDKKKYGKNKNQLINQFLSHSIQVRSVWYPNHLQKPFLNNQRFKIYNSLKLFNNSLCLPSSHSITMDQLKFIVSIIKDYANK